eukprot:TRINITY_DN7715_c0_g1_i1.p3 TRINITY_DN7715_c0_g1~~TRINITY_DN7715_c0_g1_i1.p3  ORF type:complete len:142 (-),score=28.35 TRINITY_DN7715_c0_g1_i1:7-405(-)
MWQVAVLLCVAGAAASRSFVAHRLGYAAGAGGTARTGFALDATLEGAGRQQLLVVRCSKLASVEPVEAALAQARAGQLGGLLLVLPPADEALDERSHALYVSLETLLMGHEWRFPVYFSLDTPPVGPGGAEL